MEKLTHTKTARILTALCLLAMPVSASAQQPDAGRTLQEIRRAEPPLPPAAVPAVKVDAPSPQSAPAGGAKVEIRALDIEGNTVFPRETLEKIARAGDEGAVDFAGMKAMAARITEFYRAQGYIFAYAYVPPQSLEKKVLAIRVIEGAYGDIRVATRSPHGAAAEKFLHILSRGDLIEAGKLERVTLILGDQPGYKVTPVMRPGKTVGSGDLVVNLQRTKKFGGDAGIDNHGNRYTGRGRAYVDLYALSALAFGDEFRLGGMYTQEDMWFGSASYSRPLGYSGLRGKLAYTHTYYELGKEFSNLDAQGKASIASAGLSYPLLRSQKANVSAGVAYQHKWLKDEQGATSSSDSKTSSSLPLSLNFDVRDTVCGGGITYGALTWTPGRLRLDSGLKAADIGTAETDGAFNKINLDVARLQSLPKGFSGYARVSAQMATDNLDSSESFGLGGAGGVRAYPSGEGYGDEGAMLQLELRYRVDNVEPYVFYDAGHVKINHDPWAAGDNGRTVAGAGLGARFKKDGWHADASAAWRTQGGDAQSDSKDTIPTIWFRAGREF